MVRDLEAQQPPIDPTCEWIWRAWHRLSDDRPRYGGGMSEPAPGRIPWTVILTWGRYHRLRRGEMQMLDACFGAMDATFITWWIEQQPKGDA